MPSTVIRSFDYHSSKHELLITFVSGTCYVYYDVPEQVFTDMKNFREKGIFYNRHIQNNYSFEKIKRLAATWRGLEYDSIENCTIDIRKDGIFINSLINGNYQSNHYVVNYALQLSLGWEIQHAVINAVINNTPQTLILGKQAEKWVLNDQHNALFDHCTEIDIPLTPFTNSLPINRLQLQQQQAQEIHVVYIDLLDNAITPVHQLYRKVNAITYHYENIPNDFEAAITVDENGLVVSYPELFKREQMK